jgi:Rps23 Pro-64 3,4-dihydroxylase Tpa1-like proline 4-hydroxylase
MLRRSLKEILEYQEDITFDFPYRHYVIDGLFSDDVLSDITDSNYLLSAKGNVSEFNNEYEGKIAISHLDHESGTVFSILNYLNSNEFVIFLRKLTGIPDLYGDPQFNGGGIHLIPRGGKLGIHIDFSRAIFDNTKFRRVNCLLYLNKEWKKEWEGALELWDNKPSDGGSCIKKIFPIFNRLVIFGTSKNSWHGHPTLLNCPEGVLRKSLATYYYSFEHGDDLEEHSTVY